MFTCSVLYRIENADDIDEASELWCDFGCEGDVDEHGDLREAGPATDPEPDDLGSFQVELRFLVKAESAEEAAAVYERCRPPVWHPVMEVSVSEFVPL